MLVFLLGFSAMTAGSCPYVPPQATLQFTSREAFHDASQRNELAELLVESIRESSTTNQVDAKRERKIQHLLRALTKKEKENDRKGVPLEPPRQATD